MKPSPPEINLRLDASTGLYARTDRPGAGRHHPGLESLASGLLVQYRPEIGVPGAGYSLLCVPGRERHPPVRAFCEWLAHELG